MIVPFKLFKTLQIRVRKFHNSFKCNLSFFYYYLYAYMLALQVLVMYLIHCFISDEAVISPAGACYVLDTLLHWWWNSDSLLVLISDSQLVMGSKPGLSFLSYVRFRELDITNLTVSESIVSKPECLRVNHNVPKD